MNPIDLGKKLTEQENFYFDTPLLQLRKKGLVFASEKRTTSIGCRQNNRNRKAAHKSIYLYVSKYPGLIQPRVAKTYSTRISITPIRRIFNLSATKTPKDLLTKMTLYRNMTKAQKNGVQMIGSFCNLRTKIPISLMDQKFKLKFDHSIYPKSIEIYEIEVEFPSKKQVKMARKPLEGLFLAAGVKTHTSSSKSSRLYKLLYG